MLNPKTIAWFLTGLVVVAMVYPAAPSFSQGHLGAFDADRFLLGLDLRAPAMDHRASASRVGHHCG
jgi:hypothetical protein